MDRGHVRTEDNLEFKKENQGRPFCFEEFPTFATSDNRYHDTISLAASVKIIAIFFWDTVSVFSRKRQNWLILNFATLAQKSRLFSLISFSGKIARNEHQAVSVFSRKICFNGKS